MTRTRVQQHQDLVTAGRIDHDWMSDALCIDRPDLPWLTDGPSPQQYRAMSSVCGGCPVRDACADYATTANITGGFWAGRHRDRKRYNRNPAGDLASLPAARHARTSQARDARARLDHGEASDDFEGWVS